MAIRYVEGDATTPLGTGPKIIVHVFNDIGRWARASSWRSAAIGPSLSGSTRTRAPRVKLNERLSAVSVGVRAVETAR
jgi:hypothetical protein